MANKRKDAQIFVLSYKKTSYEIPDNTLMTPLQVGTSMRGEKLFDLSDNDIEDNISDKNYFYFETTGTYYIWKQLLNNPEWQSYKYVGQMQYRRWLPISETTDFDKLFSKIDFLAVPLPFYTRYNVYDFYRICHPIKPLDNTIQIIKEIFPEYVPSMNKVLANNKIFYSAGFILPRDYYIKYAEFLFTILDKFIEMHNIKTEVDIYSYTKKILCHKFPNYESLPIKDKEQLLNYNHCIGGFLAERIFTIFVTHHFKKYIKHIKYIEPEDLSVQSKHKITE